MFCAGGHHELEVTDLFGLGWEYDVPNADVIIVEGVLKTTRIQS